MKSLFFALFYLLISLSSTAANIGCTWVRTSAPDKYWSAISMSSNGQYAVAGNDDNEIYLSTDSGANWTLKYTVSTGIFFVAISDDGQIISYCDSLNNCGYSIDGGTSFTSLTVGNSIIMSENGSIQSLIGPSSIQYTRDHWQSSGTASASANNFMVGSSGTTGQNQVAIGTDDSAIYHFYKSSDYGKSFSKDTNLVSEYPWSVSCNVNCSSVLTGTTGGVYLSNSTGIIKLFDQATLAVSQSSNSAVMAAVPDGILYVKTPYTTGWETSLPSNFKSYSVAVSRNGNMIMAAERDKCIWKCELPTPPPMTSTPTPMTTNRGRGKVRRIDRHIGRGKGIDK